MTHAVIIIGPPGAGKGTQAKALCATFGLTHVSTGDLFRANIGAGVETPLGMQAKSYINKGQLVPDNLTAEMLEARLLEEACRGGVLLDGFPRNSAQVVLLEDMFLRYGWHFSCVVELYVPDEVGGDQLLIDRMLKRAAEEGRADDTSQTIATRLDVFRAETQPVIDYYAQICSSTFVRVSCVGAIEEVTERINAGVSAHLKSGVVS